ncbi:hypothetical protein BG006_008966 [Podila minutissima]|uniref:Arylesterase n=1 Tax=Podila minutissima TaxID=64525 RepID=A0A9P5STP1_9FUNG|nr:hypothetical protein BG006_008966 [Podila minutissima]
MSKKTTSKTTTTTTRTVSSGTSSKTASSLRFSRNSIIKGTLAVLALTTALSYSFVKDAVTDLGLLLAPIQPLNTAGCVAVPGLEACEDVHIHHESGLAFTACGNSELRKSWFPPLAKLNASADPLAFQDKFVIYNLESGTYKSVEIKDLPAGTDRAFHGIDLFEKSPSELVIFLINHRRGGSVIEVLEYKVGDDFVTHKETVKHELILTPNDIVALGPRSFYVSNDHMYAKGVMREIELNLRRAWANVIYHSPEETFVAFPGVASANGMTATPDRSTVYLSACHGGGMHVLKPHADHTLEQEEYIKLDFFVDNPFYDVDTGSVFLAGHVQPLLFTSAMNYPGKTIIGPSKIVKITKKAEAIALSSASRSSYKVETVLVDDGHQISTATTAALDRQRNVMLVGTCAGVKGLHRCPIPEGF